MLLSALPIGSGPFTIAKLYGDQPGVMSSAIPISHIVSIATVSALVAHLGQQPIWGNSQSGTTANLGQQPIWDNRRKRIG